MGFDLRTTTVPSSILAVHPSSNRGRRFEFEPGRRQEGSCRSFRMAVRSRSCGPREMCRSQHLQYPLGSRPSNQDPTACVRCAVQTSTVLCPSRPSIEHRTVRKVRYRLEASLSILSPPTICNRTADVLLDLAGEDEVAADSGTQLSVGCISSSSCLNVVAGLAAGTEASSRIRCEYSLDPYHQMATSSSLEFS